MSKLTDIYTQKSLNDYGGINNEGTLEKNDVVNTTLLGFMVMMGVGTIAGIFFNVNPGLALMASAASAVALIGVWLFVAFSRNAQKYGKLLLFAFSILEGVILGSLITSLSMVEISGTSGGVIIGQAIIATVAIFVACLVAYKTGMIRFEQGSKAQSFLYIAIMGLMFISIGNFGLTLLTGNNSLWGEGWLPIVFALVALVVGALTLIDDFGQIDNAVAQGVSKEYKWMLALSLISTIVWIFVEMLRLLYSIAANRG